MATYSIEIMEYTHGLAIVTGASSGIGAEFARRLVAAASGKERYPGLPVYDEVWLVARRLDRLEVLATELRAQAGHLRIKTIPADLAGDRAVERLAGMASESGSPVSILVNNAGYGTYGDFASVDIAWQLGQIDLNDRVLTEACWRFSSMLRAGSIVLNVASLAGFAPLGGFAVYAASKAYALNFSVGLASEWKSRGIKVCALCPGSVDSEFAKVASAGVREKVRHGFSATTTTRLGLRDAALGKRISMPRFKWKLNRFAGWLFGPSLSADFAYRFMRRPSAYDQPGRTTPS